MVYPKDAESTFNSTYYLKEQLPWVFDLWKPFGMKGYKVTKLDETSPYSFLTSSYFDNEQQFESAFADSGSQIYDKIPMFSNRDAVRWGGTVVEIVL